MLKIVTALHCEAKPIIEHYKLKPRNNNFNFKVFSNDYIELIISGVGLINSAIATTYIINNSTAPDFILNVGTCGADFNKNIGEIYYINKITAQNQPKTLYPDIIVKHPFMESSINCVDYVFNNLSENEKIKDLVDMESYSFFWTANKFLHSHQISLIKIVSDNLNISKVNPRFVMQLISNNLPKLIQFIDILHKHLKKDFSKPILDNKEKQILSLIVKNNNFTEYMKNELYDFAKYYKLKYANLNILNNFKQIISKQKAERNQVYDQIKSQLLI